MVGRKSSGKLLVYSCIAMFGIVAASPAWAGSSEAIPSKEAFLLSLTGDSAACVAQEAEPGSVGIGAKPLAGCTAETTCWGGEVVSCSGDYQCISYCGSAYCDGLNVECTCDVPLPCAGWETAYCACRSCGATHQHCYSCWCLKHGENCV